MKFLIFRLLFTFFSLLVNTSFYSQDKKLDSINSTNSFKQSTNHITITGTITEIGGPLPNIIVAEKGTNNVVLSDNNGNFLINIPAEKFKNHVYLRFESLEMETKEMEVFQVYKTIKINMKSNNLKTNYSTSSWEFNKDLFKPHIEKIIINNIKTQLDKSTSH